MATVLPQLSCDAPECPPEMDILNVIDALKSMRIAKDIELPQLVVCGDQNCGKSSLLEGLTAIRFPAREGLCTQFATELQLRNSPDFGFDAMIIPDKNATMEEVQHLQSFKPSVGGTDALPTITDQAKTHMSLGKYEFSLHTLRVTVKGPALYDLTLVDLPGIFQTCAPGQRPEDKAMSHKIALQRMTQQRTIIVAVLAASDSDSQNSSIIDLVAQCDPDGSRTIGVITKPDRLEGCSPEHTRIYQEILANHRYPYHEGWHVVRNRGWDQTQMTSEQRNDVEKDYLSRGLWADTLPEHKGIAALALRLSRLFHKHIQGELPGLVADLEARTRDIEAQVSQSPLGGAEGKVREELSAAAHIWRELSENAIAGHYVDNFFHQSTEQMDPTCLRRRIEDRITILRQDFVSNGKAFATIEGALPPGSADWVIHRDLLESVSAKLEKSSSIVEGQFLPAIAEGLFYDLALPWQQILALFVDDVVGIFVVFAEKLAQYLLDPTWTHGFGQVLVESATQCLRERLTRHAADALSHHHSRARIVFAQEAMETIAHVRLVHSARALSTVMGSGGRVLRREPADRDIVTALAALPKDTFTHKMAAAETVMIVEKHYQLELGKILAEFNFTKLHAPIMETLPTVMSPSVVHSLERCQLERIASQGFVEQSAERAALGQQLDTLRGAAEKLKAYANSVTPAAGAGSIAVASTRTKRTTLMAFPTASEASKRSRR